MIEVKKFFGTWCVPCKLLTPIINEIKSELSNVKFTDVDVDENSDLVTKYGVRGVPTVVIEKDGVEVKRFVGVQQKSIMINEIISHLQLMKNIY
jgi:thioredoxin 1